MFAIECESFLIDNEHKYNVPQFHDLCFTSNYLISSVSKCDSPPASLELKPLLDSLKYYCI